MFDYVLYLLLCKYFNIRITIMLLFYREKLWELFFYDVVLFLCCYEDDDFMLVRIFVGLVDGIFVVIEVI